MRSTPGFRSPQFFSRLLRGRRQCLLGIPLLLAVAGLLFVGQGLGWFLGVETLRKTRAQLAAKERLLTSLANSEPAPTQEKARELANELATARAALAQAESQWRHNPITKALSDTATGARGVPPNSRAAYFDLARYRQELADLAHEHGVGIGREEYFGFRAYANEGPAAAAIRRVYAQRLILEAVLTALLRSRPQLLLAVICEESTAAEVANQDSRVEQSLGEETGTEGEWAAAVLRDRFQIRFRGTTAVLRDWLNALERARLPILVRSVTVEPGSERQIVPLRGGYNPAFSSTPLGEADAEGFEPLARPSASDFIVTFDTVELRLPKTSAAAHGVGATSETDEAISAGVFDAVYWAMPEAQSHGPQWVFDLFTPPEIFYHRTQQQFWVKSAMGAEFGDEGALAQRSSEVPRGGLRLIAVQREAYPLQLIGSIGNGGSGAPRDFIRGIFKDRVSGETLLLRSGERAESLGIEVLNLHLETAPVALPDNMSLREVRVAAVIRDSVGEKRHLYEGERAEGLASVARIEINGQAHEFQEGDTVSLGGELFRVEAIQRIPVPQVVVRHTDAGEDFILTPDHITPDETL